MKRTGQERTKQIRGHVVETSSASFFLNVSGGDDTRTEEKCTPTSTTGSKSQPRDNSNGNNGEVTKFQHHVTPHRRYPLGSVCFPRDGYYYAAVFLYFRSGVFCLAVGAEQLFPGMTPATKAFRREKIFH